MRVACIQEGSSRESQKVLLHTALQREDHPPRVGSSVAILPAWRCMPIACGTGQGAWHASRHILEDIRDRHHQVATWSGSYMDSGMVSCKWFIHDHHTPASSTMFCSIVAKAAQCTAGRPAVQPASSGANAAPRRTGVNATCCTGVCCCCDLCMATCLVL